MDFLQLKEGKKNIIIYRHDDSRVLDQVYIQIYYFCYFILFYHHIDLFQFLIIILN